MPSLLPSLIVRGWTGDCHGLFKVCPKPAAMRAFASSTGGKAESYWKRVAVKEGGRDGPFSLAIHDRTLKSPTSRPLILPTHAIAELLLAELRGELEGSRERSLPLVCSYILTDPSDTVIPQEVSHSPKHHRPPLFIERWTCSTTKSWPVR